MSPFIETIRIEQGEICHLSYHNQRMNATRRTLFGPVPELDLADYITPDAWQTRTKCRVEYAETIGLITYAPYRLRPVSSLRLVDGGMVTYPYKSTDRHVLDDLFNLREEQDDVLIVKNGLLTDTSICNIALWNGKHWLTPRKPLLCGTMRAVLLDSGLLLPADLYPEDLLPATRLRLFNALIDFGEVEIRF